MLARDGGAEVGFNHAHGRNAVGGEGLDDLQRRHQVVLVDFLEDGVELRAEDCARAELGEVREEGDV